MSGLYETSEATLIAAHKAGMAYWQRNKPNDATRESLTILAESCGWHSDNAVAWLAGFYGAKRREEDSRVVSCCAGIGYGNAPDLKAFPKE